jgi:hypothetical protein
MSFSMVDGVDAEYNKGSFHVLHRGIVYLNKNPETCKPFIISDNAVGALDGDGQLTVDGLFEKKHVLPAAKTISIKMIDDSVVSYLEGGFELSYNGDKYLLMSDMPMFSTSFPNLEGVGIMKGTGLHIPSSVGSRGRRFDIFEKEGEDSSKKRKRFDLDSETKYDSRKKRESVFHERAPAALELAKKALDCLQELIALEMNARQEADAKKAMFEDDYVPLENAVLALSGFIRIAQDAE